MKISDLTNEELLAINQFKKSKRNNNIYNLGLDYCPKYALHLIRLVLECEQALEEGDIDMTKNSKLLMEIKNGKFSKEKVFELFNDKEKKLESLYKTSDKLPYEPDELQIKKLLIESIEAHYGLLEKSYSCLLSASKAEDAIIKIKGILNEL